MSESPQIIASPRDDAAFAADARRIARRVPSDLPPADALAWYQQVLRTEYPNAVVREQDALARAEGSPHRVWYATNRPKPFRIATSVVVPLSVERAFTAYADRVAEWQTAVDLVPTGPTSPLTGRTYAATYRFLGVPYTGTLRVRAADPPTSVTYEASGSGMSVWYTTTFERLGACTTVTVRGDYDLPGSILNRIADRLHLERAIGRDIERANASYVRLCEAEATIRPAG
jgi:hypothetical protein